MDKEKVVIKTERLILRPWNDQDLEPFAQLTSDPRVMEHFPSRLTREESNKLAKWIQDKIDENGWGLWAATLIDSSRFIGFIGLNGIEKADLGVHFTPAIEVGWRLAYKYWGKGYATEGALAALEYGFGNLKLNEIVAYTAFQNSRSRRVMEKIGMHYTQVDDFDHPKLPEGHKLQKHVLYRLKQAEWKK